MAAQPTRAIWADRARAALTDAPESRHLFVHNDLGIVEAELGDLARARSDYTRVLDGARQVGNVEYQWRAHWGFGRAALRDNPADAVEPLERAIASIERLRQTIPEAGLRAAFMLNRVGPYETLVEAHMATASGPSDESVRLALEVAERARSRALADLLAEARARISDPRLAAVRDEERRSGAGSPRCRSACPRRRTRRRGQRLSRSCRISSASTRRWWSASAATIPRMPRSRIRAR